MRSSYNCDIDADTCSSCGVKECIDFRLPPTNFATCRILFTTRLDQLLERLPLLPHGLLLGERLVQVFSQFLDPRPLTGIQDWLHASTPKCLPTDVPLEVSLHHRVDCQESQMIYMGFHIGENNPISISGPHNTSSLEFLEIVALHNIYIFEFVCSFRL
ncbi:hypothetical protein CRG98_020024 [Punica granatum]|uniref:Uncharacterized protein n=1 Tax=Punica granatum TaxID=22663 RepID=A0A2I0JTI7_PUNGR|nr:hypothetical protein CRG98_020024 [Punica granatum]